MYYVYLLECADRSIYTGITTDVERRLREHKEGSASHYTSARRARRVIYTEKHEDRGSALRREAEIKRWKRPQKLALARRRTVARG